LAFRAEDFNIEDWLTLEENNHLRKICNIFDAEGFLVEQYKTRVYVVPVGNPIPWVKSGQLSKSAPSLYRSFNYDDEGNVIGSVPEMREWLQDCEDAANGGIVDPTDPTGVPAGLKVANSTYIPGEALAVDEDTIATIVSKVLLPDEEIYLRHVMVSGENQGKFQVLVNGTAIGTKRTWFSNFNEDFWFSTANGGILYKNEETIEVKVLNCGDDEADFESSLGYVVKTDG